MRRIAVLDAPSNLGLRPPTATSVPGCAKAPGALRDHGLLARLHARDAGCLTPPRYDPGDWRPGDGVAHAAQIAAYSRALADRIGAILDAGEFPVVLGGDCSILLGSGLAMHRLGAAVGGRIGLVFVDGHSDFRHPGNASYVGAAAGEDLALVTGRGQADLAAIEGRRPYFRDIDVVVLGIRSQDEYRLDLQAAGIVTRPVPALRAEGAARSAQWARDQLVDCAGYWLHVDVDVLDPAVMPAVDAPSPGGIAFPELELLLAGLVESPHCLGVEITVFDPDYDPDGLYAAEITSTVAAGLAAARTVTPRPDLIAARADLSRGPSRAEDAQPVQRQPEERQPEERQPEERQPEERPTGAASPTDIADMTEMSPATDISGQNATANGEAAGKDVLYGGVTGKAAGEDAPYGGVTGRRMPHGQAAGQVTEIPPVGAFGLAEPVARLALSDLSEPLAPGNISGRTEMSSVTEIPVFGGVAEEAGPNDESVDKAVAPGTEGGGQEAAAVPAGSGLQPAAGGGQVGAGDEQEAVAGGEQGAAAGSEQGAAAGSAQGAAAGSEEQDSGDAPVRLVTRPLGQAPLLDSEPLPATRPGMLRPRPIDDHGESFSLPAQRPAFDLGSGEPADIA